MPKNPKDMVCGILLQWNQDTVRLFRATRCQWKINKVFLDFTCARFSSRRIPEYQNFFCLKRFRPNIFLTVFVKMYLIVSPLSLSKSSRTSNRFGEIEKFPGIVMKLAIKSYLIDNLFFVGSNNSITRWNWCFRPSCDKKGQQNGRDRSPKQQFKELLQIRCQKKRLLNHFLPGGKFFDISKGNKKSMRSRATFASKWCSRWSRWNIYQSKSATFLLKNVTFEMFGS